MLLAYVSEFDRNDDPHADTAADYGVLSALNGKISPGSSSNLSQVLERQSKSTNLTAAELLLSWAFDRLDGIVVSSTSREDRARQLANLFVSGAAAAPPDTVYAELEKAAVQDGYADKRFYKHGHMEAASKRPE